MTCFFRIYIRWTLVTYTNMLTLKLLLFGSTYMKDVNNKHKAFPFEQSNLRARRIHTSRTFRGLS